MKHIKIIFLIIFIATAINFSISAQNRVSVSQSKYTYNGDSVYVELQVELNNAEVYKNRFILLTPVIKSEEEAVELPVILINGKERQKIYNRTLLMNPENEGIKNVIDASEKNAPRYYYKEAIAFEDWMKGAEFSISEDQCECGGPLVHMSFDLITGTMKFESPYKFPIYLKAVFKEPDPEPIKSRTESGKAYLDFAIGRSDLDPNYTNNTDELKKIGDMVKKAKNDPAVTITGVSIDGYASPDGPYTNNMLLSGKRSASLKEYISTVYVLDENLLSVMGHGEDWETFETLIEDSDNECKLEILEIIRSTDGYDEREKKLMGLYQGTVYKDLLANVFPKLRRSDYELRYTVIPFSIEEGKKKLEKNPEHLSLNEMFLIAQSYPFGSADFRKVFDIAAETYPYSEIANFNAAANALDARDADTAEEYLRLIKTKDADYLNNMGVLSAMRANYDEAVGYFKLAAEKGNPEAPKNIDEIEKVKQQLVSK